MQPAAQLLSMMPSTLQRAEPTKIKPADAMKPYGSTKQTPAFFGHLFRLLDAHGVRYCVLHAWERIPQEVVSDVDLAIHPADRSKLAKIFGLLRDMGFVPIQCFHYSVGGFYFVFSWFDGCTLQSVPLDIIFQHWRSGLSVLRVEDLLARRQRFKDLWIPSLEDQFAYLLAKRTWKGKASEEQASGLKDLVERLGRPAAERIASQIFPGEWSNRIVAACLDGSIAPLLRSVRKYPWLVAVVRHPLALIRYTVGQSIRIARRLRHPTGLLIAVVGPDGSGKDTVINALRSQLSSGFRRVKQFHWRPHLLFPKKNAPAVTSPHASPPRSAILSSFYLLGFVLDYWLGYVLSIRPAIFRSNLVIFDRYFYDVIVDPRRSRFGGPSWLPRWLARLVHRPDLILLLDADENLMYTRKKELPVEELRRQRQAYRDVLLKKFSTRVISTNEEVSRSVEGATSVVVELLYLRFATRHQQWISGDA
jgi:thymidylate kinase